MKLDPAKIKRRRDELTYGQTEIARLAGMTVQQWHNLEKGQRPDPRVSTVARLAKALRCKIEDLLSK